MHVAVTQSRLANWQSLKWIALAVASLFAVATLFLTLHWPFNERSVIEELGEASQTRVQAASSHGTYFPRPGIVLEHVTFQHNPKPGSPPLFTVDTLRIEGSLYGLFTRHLKLMRAYGLHLRVPPLGSENFATPKRSSFVIDELTADGATLEIASREVNQPGWKFVFQQFLMHEVGSSGPATFEAKFSNPEPSGAITAKGKFGPWNENDVGKTPVSGKYSFENADLGVFGGIGGIFSSTGDFSGVLNHIDAKGEVNTPEFKVASSSHKVALRTEFEAEVNGENGDTVLKRVTAHFLDTTILSDGSVQGREKQEGKAAALEFAAQNGQIQDLLLLFTSAPRAPMAGAVSFHAKASLPPGDRPFLERVELQGRFGIDDGRFTQPTTQSDVNHLSEGALGKAKEQDPSATVLSNLRGQVLLKRGIATFSNLSFSVPGAQAQMEGTYSLVSQKIDLHGTLKTDSEPANAAHGIKSAMLRVIEPLFKKKKRGYAMPVKITGTYQSPSFGLDLSHPEAKHFRPVRVPGFKQPG